MLVLIVAVGALPVAAITNGELDGEGHPNVGLLIVEEMVDGEVEMWRCSGTLIAPRVFLTAGHCVYGMYAARVWFDTDLTDNEEYPYGGETSVEGTPIPHPDYNWGDADPHDVGVVILDEAVDIELAALPDPDWLAQLKKDRILEGGHKDGVYFRSVGYGGTLESWPPPVLAYEKIRRVSESEYVALTKVHLHLSQKAVFDESGSCFGDSGGPVFWVDPEGNEIIVAVTSTGDAQCVATGLNYRVDVPETLAWIYSQLPGEE
jgi:secreted trypsin-like serine protease